MDPLRKILSGRYSRRVVLKRNADELCRSPKCGLNFRRVLDLGNVPDNINNIDHTDAARGSVKSLEMVGPVLPRNSLKRKRGETQEEVDEVSLFRRVRIYNIVHSLVLPNPPRSDLNYRCKVYELRKNDWEDRGTGFVNIRLELKVEQLTFLVYKYFQERALREALTQTNRLNER